MTRYTPNGQLLSSESGVDLSLLPPCSSSLKTHIQRANYQALIWARANEQCPDIPQPEDGHGWVLVDGVLAHKWTDDEMLPKELVDMVVEQGEQDEDLDQRIETYYFDVEEEVFGDESGTEDEEDGD